MLACEAYIGMIASQDYILEFMVLKCLEWCDFW